MLRTVAARNQVVTHGLKKVIRNNVTRCLSTELSRNNVQNRLLKPQQCSHHYPTQTWSLSVRGYASYPSHVKVNLPALSPTMEMGTIVRWEKKEGDKLSEGDLLCEIETDKATMGFETPEEGYLAKILIKEGTSGVPVGKLLCIIVEKQEDVAAFKDFKDDSPAPPAPAAKPAAAPAAAAPPPPPPPKPVAAAAPPPMAAPAAAPKAAAPPSGERVYASPMARRLAEIRQVRLQGTGSGLYGSIKSDDLSGMAAGGAPAPGAGPAGGVAIGDDGATYTDIPISGMRATIAKRMVMSKQNVPAFVITVAVNVDKTLRVREQINKRIAKSGAKITINDIIVKAVAAACKREPNVNAHWMDTFIRQFHQVDISVAVATPTGLITPIVFNADSRGVLDISTTIKELAGRAKEGKLRPDEYQGGTVTVSNLGTSGVHTANAIINPPQAMIIAVGGIYDVVVPEGDTGFKVAKFINFTMSGDHRVMDGIDGARFMATLKENMEDPANIML